MKRYFNVELKLVSQKMLNDNVRAKYLKSKSHYKNKNFIGIYILFHPSKESSGYLYKKLFTNEIVGRN